MDTRDAIAFVLDDSESDAHRLLSVWSNAKKHRAFARCRLAAITFADDRMFIPIQASDLLAYGVGKEYPNGKMPGQNGPFRGLFSPIEEHSPNPLEWEHWDTQMFTKNPDIIDDYGTID
jgi:hypothetical protein